MELRLIDGIGPFFRHTVKDHINWSKIPFGDIETADVIRPSVLASVPEDFRTLVARTSAMGFNAVTLDDLAHLITDPDYPTALKGKLQQYRSLYRELFSLAAAHGMRVFMTTDIMFYNATLSAKLGSSRRRVSGWLEAALEEVFAEFPEIEGVIIRIGETDGLEVGGDFCSRLLLRRPSQARYFLKRLLPVFERHARSLVFRTWSVGAYSIGDLIWNRRTFDRVFAGIDSPSLIISMKYGESDFFRYLPLNKLFFRSDHRKIVEFQARREYEGFGAYPSFVGWDSESYLTQLREARNVIGASVWCQTGGWGKRRQLTFLRHSSPWAELNVYVLSRLFAGDSCDEAIARHAAEAGYDAEAWRQFLVLSEVVIKDLLYMRELGERQLFFRRLRLPPQLLVFWDRVIVNHTMKRLLGCLVSDPASCLAQGRSAFARLEEMRALAERHGLPNKGLAFQMRTFEILVAAREYFFQPYAPERAHRLIALRDAYETDFRRHYSLLLDFEEAALTSRQIQWGVAFLLRRRRRYRRIDQLATLSLLSWVYPLLRRWQRKLMPEFANQTAMGLDAVFR